MIFYALFSESQKSYNTPFLAHDDKEAISIVSKTVVAHQDPALVMSLDDLSLCKVGVFDPSGLYPVDALVDHEVVLDHLDRNLPLPPMIKSQVDKIYQPKEVSDAAQ